jgi:hypothetical protein
VFSVVFDFVWVRDPEDDVLELLGRENDAAAVERELNAGCSEKIKGRNVTDVEY